MTSDASTTKQPWDEEYASPSAKDKLMRKCKETPFVPIGKFTVR